MTTTSVEHEVTYLEAISEALDEEMARDERVFLMGEDIGPYGGAFRITEGFQKKYGEWRVLDTPLSESGFFWNPSVIKSERHTVKGPHVAHLGTFRSSTFDIRKGMHV